MHHPEEEEDEDEDEFLSDDLKAGHSKDQTKLKGECRGGAENAILKCSRVTSCVIFVFRI